MASYAYQLLNVFALPAQRLSGNPLCVFEDARGLSDAQMQALALQFNLSETTFVLPSAVATARVRIFTPTFEMNFAGHPTLGTAAVVQGLQAMPINALTLEMHAGVIPVSYQAACWQLTANEPTWRPVAASHAQLAAMLGVDEADVAEPALWVNTGSEQLVIPLKTADAVARCRPDAHLLQRHATLNGLRSLAYVWAPDARTANTTTTDLPSDDGLAISARFFFAKGSAVIEDPATGSAAANLGGWWLANERPLPAKLSIAQGSAVGRPSLLGVELDASGLIQVSGHVVSLGRGVIDL